MTHKSSVSEESIGCSTLAFRKANLDKALDSISSAGFNKVEIVMVPDFCSHLDPLNVSEKEIDALKANLKKKNFSVNAITVNPGPLNLDNSGEKIEYIKKAISITSRLESPKIILASGAKVEKSQWIRNALVVKKHLKDLADYAEKFGVEISVEAPHNNTLTENHFQTVIFFKLLNDSRIKCTFDTSHATSEEKYNLSTVLNYLYSNRVRINHIHLRDIVLDNIEKTPGKGNIDFRILFDFLRKNNFTGEINYELESDMENDFIINEEITYAKKHISNILNTKQRTLKERIAYNPLSKEIRRLGDIVSRPKNSIRRSPLLFGFAAKLFYFYNNIKPQYYHQSSWISKSPFRDKLKIRDLIKSPLFSMRKPDLNLGRTINVGILGCGWAGASAHGPALERIKNVKIVAVCDVSTERADHTSRKFNCKAYYDLEDMINSGRIDVVVNCTPEIHHYPTTLKLLDAGIDVFCEKIMAESYDKALEMVDKSKDNNRVLAVNYNYRFIPGIIRIKQLIESEEFGKLVNLNIFVHAFSYHHILDLILFLGGKVKSVFSIYDQPNSAERKIMSKIRGDASLGDWRDEFEKILYMPYNGCSLLIELNNGLVATVTSSMLFESRTLVLNLEAIFEKEVVTFSGLGYNNLGRLTSSNGSLLQESKKDKTHKTDFTYTFDKSIESFVKNYCGDQNFETDGEHALEIIRLENKIAKSNNSGKNIFL